MNVDLAKNLSFVQNATDLPILLGAAMTGSPLTPSSIMRQTAGTFLSLVDACVASHTAKRPADNLSSSLSS
jgi:hypothetical protein